MMYAYSASTKRSVMVAVVALAVVMSGQRAQAQPGTVLSHQKISSTEGGGPPLGNGDVFGRVASLGDLDGGGLFHFATARADNIGVGEINNPITIDISDVISKAKVKWLLNGTVDTVKVLYLGNSRVMFRVGFDGDGVRDIIYERGRVAGEAFIIPRGGADQDTEDVNYIFNSGPGTTNTNSPEWLASQKRYLIYAHAGQFSREGLLLDESRTFKITNFANDNPLLPRDEEVVLTVQYFVGEGMGKFKVTPVDVLGPGVIVFEHPPTIIDTNAAVDDLEFLDIVMPPVTDPINLNRSFTLSGVEGETVIYRVNVIRNVAGGVSFSNMAIGAMGYYKQLNEDISLETWKKYVEAYLEREEPVIVLLQYAPDSGGNKKQTIPATKTFMDTIKSVNPEVLFIVTPDHPTPRSDYKSLVANSWEWAEALRGYHRAIVIDPVPYLPQDFLDLAGTGEVGDYFIDSVHENRVGARVVADAIWQALEDFADGVLDRCPWDLFEDGNVGAVDLLTLLASWGPCKGCPADFDDNGEVGASDLLALLANWGACP